MAADSRSRRLMVASIRSRRAFGALSSSRQRANAGAVWVTRAPSPAGAVEPQVAYAVGKPVGTAVVRNRIRRRLRSIVAELVRAGELPPALYLIGTRPKAATLPFHRLRDDVRSALQAVASR